MIATPPLADHVSPVDRLLREAEALLAAAGIHSPSFEAKVILGHVLGLKPSRLAAHLTLTSEAAQRVRRLLARRANREPLQYVTGDTEFLGLRLKCRPGVFIPRPETELLVEAVVQRLRRRPRPPLVADVGCGNGAIALGLAALLPPARVVATDVSPQALQLAAENAESLGLSDRVTFLQGSFIEPLRLAGLLHRLDAIVCNPPYVPSGQIDGLAPEVAVHEPREALDGGPDGLSFYRRLVADLAASDRPLLVALEAGVGQAPAVRGMLRNVPRLLNVRIIKDYSDIQRIVLAE
ncbi:MAG: peptide chain release factor N(5)-glutamine methyltransferase [Armatimonadota bacterium]